MAGGALWPSDLYMLIALLRICIRWFLLRICTGLNQHETTIGEIFLDFFPTTKQANPSFTPPKKLTAGTQKLVVWVHVSPFPFGWNTFRFQLFVHSFFKIVTRWAPMIVINEVMTPISRVVRGPINPFIVGTGPPCSHWSHEAMVSCKVIRQEKLYLSERHLSLEARSIKIQQQRQWQPCELSTVPGS